MFSDVRFFYFEPKIQVDFKPEMSKAEIVEWKQEEEVESSDSEVEKEVEDILAKSPELKYPSKEMFSNLRFVFTKFVSLIFSTFFNTV